MSEKVKELAPPEPEGSRNAPSSATSVSDAGAGSGSDTAGANLEKLDSKVVPVEPKDPLARLSEEERYIIKRQIDIPDVSVKYFDLYKYGSRVDICLVLFAHFTSICAGAVLPLMTILFGQLTGTFSKWFLGEITKQHFTHELTRYTVYFVYMAVGEFVLIYTCTVLAIYTGEHITGRIRKAYLKALLRQNIAIFDKLGAGEVTTRITADTNLIQEGLSEKTTLTTNALSTFITAFVIGFIKSWKLTLILCSTVLAITVIMGTGSSFIVKFNKASINSYALGGTLAEEVFSSVRNAVAFGTQRKLAENYDKHLREAEKYGIKHRTMLGVMIGMMMWIVYLNYALAFWEGSRLLFSHDVSISAVITCLMAVIIGAFSLGNVAPNIQAIGTSVAAASKIFSAIERQSPIDPLDESGEKPDQVEGQLELINIKHIYPSRPEVTVLEDMNLVIPAGKVTALVGASGSGKSTIVGLVERFYDPVGGQVLLDGRNVKDLNLRWLRQKISLVQQEPVLFNTTIFENVAFGLIGTPHEHASEEKKRELVVAACEMSNAASFIDSLPEGYETNVGERSVRLSGGQKQRIAIARAVVSDPKVLLLDEATSALDTRSEGVVQRALDKASRGRTTICIAHRLSTIKDADNIVVMQNGRIVEQGTHADLLSRKGAYYKLVDAQKFQEERREEEIEAAEDEQIAEAADLKLAPTKTNRSNKTGANEDPEDVELGNRLNRATTSKSVSSIALEKKKAEQVQKYSLGTLIRMTASFNKTEIPIMIVGLVFCVVCGLGYPVQSIFFAFSITTLSLPPNQYDKMKHDARIWSLAYLGLAFLMLAAYSIQGVAFAYCSERLVHRVRDRAFRTLLRQDISYFDHEDHTTGALTSFLSTETTSLAGLSGSTLGTILIVTTTLFGAIILSLAIGWKLALVCISTIPVLLACGFFRFWMLARFQARSKKAYENSAGYACEASGNIRTVASLVREADVIAHYENQIAAQEKVSLRSILRSSSLYAFSQSLVFCCTALGFWYGGTLLRDHEYSMKKFFIVFMSIIFGSQSAGTIFSFAPDMGKAKQAAQSLKELFDRKPEIDTWSDEGEDFPECKGAIEFRDVHFRYPTRPQTAVLRGLDLVIKPGQYVALVGPSGCGKSTTISLIERFYDVTTGGVYVDGKEITNLNLNQYRRQLSLVSQEPVLYSGTIRENIMLGAEGEDITEEQIVQACKEANIYEFILSLPDGFNTLCGTKGTLLSGGQKQRICIARALIRNPKILLLDESTSALDSESERVVQAALDEAIKKGGRTTVAVAHRLSTIQNADVIYVFENGKICESGDHKSLMAKKGRYHELVNLQTLGLKE